jgi:serine/threonine-protein kinase
MPGLDGKQWRALEPLLDHALELSGEERESWLSAVRQHTPDLGTELAAILSGEAIADEHGFLTEPLVGPEPSLEGLPLGAYTLDRLIGRGGMGSVWLAHRSDGRYTGQAAVKLLNLALITPAGQARFRREGSMLARLTHPGIARLLDAGVGPDGQSYLVLEYIDGQPIDSFAIAHDLSIEDRLRLFLQVLEAVGHAHTNLIVHRDLKPSNILVTDDGTVKLLDFGIGKLLDSDADDAERSAVTVEGAQALTPRFAAPEQVNGGPITTATDVYALGVLLYMMMSRRHPTAEGCSGTADVILALRGRQPTLLPGDLGRVADKALQKRPGDRYQTVSAFADDVKRYLAHEPVSAHRSSLVYRATKFARRHAAVVTGVTLTALALLAATVFSIGQMRNARRQRDAAVFAGKQAAAQVDFLSILMAQLGTTPLTMRELVDRARLALDQQRGGDPRFQASLLVQLSERYADLGESTVRGQLLTRAESIAVASGYADGLAEIRCNLADNQRTQGRYAEAQKTLDGADSLLRAHPDPAVQALCLQMRADLQIEAGPHEGTLGLIERALAIRDSIKTTEGISFVALLADFASALDMDGRHREAIAVYRRVGSILDSTGLGSTMTSAVNEHDMAVALFQLGETAEGERLFRDVIARVSGSDPSGRFPPQPLIHYAHAALFQRHFDTAAKYFSILNAQGVADSNTYWQGRALFGLAESQIALGHLADAQRTMATFRPMSANPKLQRASDDQLVDYRILEAQIAFAAGHAADARRQVTDALRSAGYFAGKRRAVFRSALILAAELALRAGDLAGAASLARDASAVVTQDSLTSTRSAFVGEARLVEAEARLARGDTTGAQNTLTQAATALEAGAGPAHPRTAQARALLGQLGTAAR